MPCKEAILAKYSINMQVGTWKGHKQTLASHQIPISQKDSGDRNLE